MAGEYLDPSRWPLWMQSAAMGPMYPRNRTFGTDAAMPAQNVPGLLDGLKNAGDYIADRFNNPPDELSMIGTAGQAYRDLTMLSRAFIKDPSARSPSWLRPVRPLAPTTRQKNEDRFGDFIGAIKKAAVGDPNGTVNVSVDESGRPLHTLTAQEFSERYPGQTHPMVEAGNMLSALAITGGMPFAVRNALGATGGRLPPNNVTRLSLERARRQPMLWSTPSDRAILMSLFIVKVQWSAADRIPQGGIFLRSQKAARSEGATATAEYRLNFDKTLDLTADRTRAGDMARVIGALNETHPQLATQWVKSTAPAHVENPSVEEFIKLANARPDHRVDRPAIHLLSILRAYKVNPETIFFDAGYDAIDSVQACRSSPEPVSVQANALFDPLKRKSHNIMASIPVAGVLPWASLTVDPDQE